MKYLAPVTSRLLITRGKSWRIGTQFSVSFLGALWCPFPVAFSSHNKAAMLKALNCYFTRKLLTSEHIVLKGLSVLRGATFSQALGTLFSSTLRSTCSLPAVVVHFPSACESHVEYCREIWAIPLRAPCRPGFVARRWHVDGRANSAGSSWAAGGRPNHHLFLKDTASDHYVPVYLRFKCWCDNLFLYSTRSVCSWWFEAKDTSFVVDLQWFAALHWS